MNEASPREDHGSVQLGFAGDLVLGRRVSAKLEQGFPAADMWGDLRPHMTAADAMIGNLEGPITRHAKRWPWPKAFYFRADPLAVAALTAGNFRCLALANNHMLDFRAEGIAETRQHLADAGIAFAGAGAGAAETREPAIFDAGGRRIGFVSITNTVPAFAATDTRAGTCYWPIRTDRDTLGRLAGLVLGLRRRGAEILVLSIHWGPNYRWWPPPRYRSFARRAIELGFDIIHGHSAHLLQAAEFHGTGVILYDTGDFIDDFWPVPGLPTWRSFLFLIETKPGGPPALTMIPATLGTGTVAVASDAEARLIRDGMVRRCRGYAIDLAETNGTLIGRPPR